MHKRRWATDISPRIAAIYEMSEMASVTRWQRLCLAQTTI